MGKSNGNILVIDYFVFEIVDVAQTIVHCFEPELGSRMHFHLKDFISYASRADPE